MRRARRLLFALALASVVHLSSRAGAGSPHAAPPARAPEALVRIGALVEEHGPPSVMVEAERPERTEDRRVVARVISLLADCGLRAVDGEEYRRRRRELADGANAQGLQADEARAALERIDADYVLRVSVSVSDAGSSESYGMRIDRRGCSLAPTLMRVPELAVLAVDPSAAESGSSTGDAAAESAQQAAAVLLAASVTEAVCADWLAVAEGRRAWVLELAGGVQDPRAAIESVGAGGAEVLEHVPRGRTLVRVDGETVSRLRATSEPGCILALRPGYVRVSMPTLAGAADGRGGLIVGMSVAAAALAAAALAWTFSARGPSAPSSRLPGE